MTIQVLGLCRFSYVAEGGFKVEHGSVAERRAFLYDPSRLALRFMMFERICLPAWRAQTDPDFTLLLLTGRDFPKLWLDRLQGLIADLPQAKIVQEDPGPHRDVCRRVFRRHVDPKTGVVAQFRHDDDDAVAVDYVARIRSDFAQKLRPIYAAHPLLSVDYARGMTLNIEAGEVALYPCFTHSLGVALTVYMPPGHPNSVLNFAHHRLSAHMPGVSFQDSIMYVRGRHAVSDSGDPKRIGFPYKLDDADQADTLKARFNIDLPGLRAAVARHDG